MALYFLPKKKLFGNTRWRRQAKTEYLKACQFFGAILIDRTQTLDTGIAFDILDPLENLETTEKTFAEICEERAKNIIENIDLNKTITLLWSGGIDSTVALISFIKVLRVQNQISRLKVLLSEESIGEYTTFFQEEIEGKIRFEYINHTIYETINPEEVNITGEHGDQIFGSDKLKYAIISGEAFRSYQEVLPYLISRKLGTHKYTDKIIAYLAPQVAQSPLPIVSVYDYLWWMNFSLKWQNVAMRLVYGLRNKEVALDKNLIHFFSSQEFQSWSISNHHQKIKQSWQSYKYIAKNYIYKFHQDLEYLENKEKEPSLKQVIVEKNKTHTRPWNITKIFGKKILR